MESDYFLQLGKLYIRFIKNTLNGTYINHRIWQLILVERLGGKSVLQKETEEVGMFMAAVPHLFSIVALCI